MPPKKKSPSPVPKIKVKVEYLHEDWEVEIICPKWAMHKLNGGEPSDAYEEEAIDTGATSLKDVCRTGPTSRGLLQSHAC